MKEFTKLYMKKGQTTIININFLIGVLEALRKEGEIEVKLRVLNDKPLMLNDIFLIADKIEDD